jgi:drug/metabolite transporter (DMT)-like permease
MPIIERCNFMDDKVLPVASDIFKGSLYGVIAFFCMAVFGIITKLALDGGSAFWVSFIAYLTGALLLLPFILQKGIIELKSDHYGLLLGRAVFGTVASFCYTISMHYIPIVNGTLLFNTAPLFIPILAMIFLKEKINKSTWIAVLIGFIGIIVIIKPTEAIFTQGGNFIGIFSGISLAIAYLMMKVLTKTDPGIRIIFYYLGIGTLMQIPALFFAGGLPSLESVLYSMAAGVFLLAAQLTLVTAYRYAQASQIGIYQYSSVVFVGLIDWLLWNTIPNSGEIIGALLVAFAGIIVIRSSAKKVVEA